MVFLGLLLVLLAVGATALVAGFNRSGGPEYTVTLFGNDVATVNTWQAFLAGVAVAVLVCVGLAMIMVADRRHRAVGAEVAAARRDAEAAAAERDRLAGRLERQEPAAG